MNIGIVIPCKDQQQYLKECVQSILDQGVIPSSVVIVDDGSEEPVTIEHIPETSGKFPIWLVRNEKSVGIAGARNIGITLIGTNWFIPLDADDVLKPNCLERSSEVVEIYPEVDIVQWGFERFDEDEYQDLRYPLPVGRTTLQHQNPAHHTALIRVKVWEAVGGFTDIGGGSLVRGYEDWDFWAKVDNHPYRFVIYILREALFKYRLRKNSKAGKQDREYGRTELKVKYRHTWGNKTEVAKCLKELRTLMGVQRIG